MSKKIKKILSLILVVALTIGVSIFGTIAYFTDEDSAVNVMTVGNVRITQNEQERIDHKNVEVGLQEFTQGQSIVPAADVTGEKTPIMVNDYLLNIRTGETYVDKIVSVTNDGVNDAYVRTIFAFPEAGEFDTTTDASEQWFHWNGVSDTDTTPNNGWMWGNDKSEWPGNAEGWDVVENVEINGKKYDVYVSTNKNVLDSGSSTSPSLMGFYLDTRVDFNGSNYIFTDNNGKEWNLGDISELDILVLSQACQTEGFEDAWTALDTVFGDVNKENVTKWFGNIKKNITVSTSDELVSALQTETEDNETVTVLMLNDIEVTSGANITGNIILNMAGHTLSDTSGEVGVLLRAKPNGKLTITGNGQVYSENHNKWMLYTDGDGEIIVENGTFVKAPYTWGNDCGYDGCDGGESHTSNAQKLNPLLCGKGVITVYDGYFDCGILNPEYVEQNSRPVVHDCMYPTINLGIDSGDDHIVIYGGTFVTANPVDGDDNPRGSTNEGNSTATEKAFFLYGQEEYGVLPEGYSVVTGTTEDGRITYTYSYTK